MYAGNYGFPHAAAGPPYNGAPPLASQNAHLQPGSSTPNQIMYNPQQFPMGPQGGASFPGNPSMMSGAGPAMQNNDMPQMAPNGQMPNYQTPYSNTPYGGGVPSSLAPQMNGPPSYAITGGMPMTGFPMHQGMHPPQQQQQQQQMMQRMHPSQPNSTMSTPTPQRNFQSQPPQGAPTPNNAQTPHNPHFPTPQSAQGTPQSQTPNNAQQHQQQQSQQRPQQSQQQPSSNSIQTPQTPTFPATIQGPVANGTSSNNTPLSPGADSRDKDRMSIILEINNELLLEAMQIQNTQQVIKKELAAGDGTGGTTVQEGKKPTEEEALLAQDYIHCMRRLGSNLSYLAAMADKKGTSQQPCPAYMRAPPLSTSVRLRPMPNPDGTEIKSEVSSRESIAKYLAELYKKLQGLYPGIDPSREPAGPASTGQSGAQASNAMKSGSQVPAQGSPEPGKQRTSKLSSSGPLQPTTSVLAT